MPTIIEVNGVKLDEDKLMGIKPQCDCCRRRETRLILPNSRFNTTGEFLLHCYLTGRMKPVDIVDLLRRQGLLDQVKVEE